MWLDFTLHEITRVRHTKKATGPGCRDIFVWSASFQLRGFFADSKTAVVMDVIAHSSIQHCCRFPAIFPYSTHLCFAKSAVAIVYIIPTDLFMAVE